MRQFGLGPAVRKGQYPGACPQCRQKADAGERDGNSNQGR